MADSSHGYDADGTLFGRDREREVLRQALEQALSGQGGLALVGGEAGIGKTSLVRAAIREASANGARVLTSACHDLMVTPPYGPWLEIYANFDGVEQPPLPMASWDGTSHLPASQDALFAEAFDLLAAESESSPLVLVLEDLHWTDAASVEFLRYCARRLRDFPILVIATYRDNELDRRNPMRGVLPVIIRESEPARINLRPLDDASVSELVDSIYSLTSSGLTRLVNYLQQRTEGNPFFVGEMLRTLEENGYLAPSESGWIVGDLQQIPVPRLIKQVIEGRLDRLPEYDRHLLAIASVIGQEIPLEVWKTVGDVSDEELERAAKSAMSLNILEESPGNGSLHFTHSLVREALYDELGLTQRRRLHQSVGELLASRSSPAPDAVAFHLQEARHDQAPEWMMTAGERAQQLYAWRTAAERFESVLDLLGEDPTLVEERGWLAYRAGRLLTYADPERGIAHFQTAERLARTIGSEHLKAYALADRGLLRCLTGDVRRGLQELQRGVGELDQLPPLTPPESTSDQEHPALSLARIQRGVFDLIGQSTDVNTLQGSLVFWLAWSGRYTEALALGETYVEQTPDSPDSAQDSLGDAFAGLGHAYAALGRPEEALESFSRARDVYGSIDHHFKVGNTAIYELSEAFLPYRADRIMERQWLADQAEAG